jgi:hypothetical protein
MGVDARLYAYLPSTCSAAARATWAQQLEDEIGDLFFEEPFEVLWRVDHAGGPKQHTTAAFARYYDSLISSPEGERPGTWIQFSLAGRYFAPTYRRGTPMGYLAIMNFVARHAPGSDCWYGSDEDRPTRMTHESASEMFTAALECERPSPFDDAVAPVLAKAQMAVASCGDDLSAWSRLGDVLDLYTLAAPKGTPRHVLGASAFLARLEAETRRVRAEAMKTDDPTVSVADRSRLGR